MMYQKSVQEAEKELRTDLSQGLTPEEAAKRLQENGPNELKEKKGKTKLQIFLTQLNDPMIYILFAAAAVSILLKEVGDACIILVVVLLNAFIGMFQEAKAEKALEALKKLSSPYALVKRGGNVVEIPAKDLVVGDVVVLDAGRIIPADLRLTSTVNLKIEESALTGESVPVEKHADYVADKEVGIGDRINMAYSSTSVAYGRGEGVVVATAEDTEIGKIAQMISEAKDEMTPLQKRLADLGKLLGGLAVLICVALFGIAVWQQRDVMEMLLTAISLAVAAIPEGLPAVVAIVLALGVQRMVKVNTIVRRLPAVETLGAVSVVCSDKTGTLTQNRMTVTHVYVNGQSKDVKDLDPKADETFLKGFILCNDASIAGGSKIGDPTEIALLDMGVPFGMAREEMETTQPRVAEQAFDSGRKMMTTVHKEPSGRVVSYTKGATDVLLSHCTHILENGVTRPITQEDLNKISAGASQMATLALRVLALAIREDNMAAEEENLTFVGLVGMIDPPRPEAKGAVADFKKASIRTIMITGDHKDTALAIAKELGIADSDDQCITGADLSKMTQEELNAKVNSLRVFARVSPEHKVMIVKAFQSHGYIVSMTGDGVNDAPSLKTADIGVAMGITGTDVSKSAADMVLTDDNFATIRAAVEEGRSIYNNIKKSVLFLLSSNFGEVLTMFTSIIAGLAAPLQAIHILWVNLITDSLPALGLGVDNKEKGIMDKAPRDPNESLFAHGGMALAILYGLVIGGLTLTAFLYSPVKHLTDAGMAINLSGIKLMLENPDILVHAQTYAFVTLAMSQLFHAFGMRDTEHSIFQTKPFSNKVMLLAFVIGLGLQVAVTEIPFLCQVFGTVALSMTEWLELAAFACVPLLVHEIVVLVKKVVKR